MQFIDNQTKPEGSEQDPTGFTIYACPICDKGLYHKKKIQAIENNELINKSFDYCYNCKKTVKGYIRKNKHDYVITKKKSVFNTSANEILSQSEILHILKTMPEHKNRLRDQALISILYLTGSRISEIVGQRVKTGGYKVEPVTKKQIRYFPYKNRDFLIFEQVPILKRRMKGGKIPRKTVPVPMVMEKEFCDYIINWAKTKATEDYMFKMTAQRAWQLVKLHFPAKYPHYFRHIRTTHLVKMGMPLTDVKKMIGWSDMNSAAVYEHLGIDYLVDKFIDIESKHIETGGL